MQKNTDVHNIKERNVQLTFSTNIYINVLRNQFLLKSVVLIVSGRYFSLQGAGSLVIYSIVSRIARLLGHKQGLKMSNIEKIHLGFSNTPFSLSVCMHG